MAVRAVYRVYNYARQISARRIEEDSIDDRRDVREEEREREKKKKTKVKKKKAGPPTS